MSYQFQRESWLTIMQEAGELLAEHYLEIAHYHDIPLAPDHDAYLALDKNGSLRVFTVRDESDKALVGYAVFFIRRNLHYKSSLQAVQDIVFIKKDRRGFGKRLIEFCDENLKSEGVQVVYHHVKTKFNWGPMLERMGYEAIDVIYGKRLDQPSKQGGL